MEVISPGAVIPSSLAHVPLDTLVPTAKVTYLLCTPEKIEQTKADSDFFFELFLSLSFRILS